MATVTTRQQKFPFTWSCAGTINYRHNLNLPSGPGGRVLANVRITLGSAYVKTLTANTMQIQTATAAGDGFLEMPDGVIYGDYPTS